jgi:hypothetical protein
MEVKPYAQVCGDIARHHQAVHDLIQETLDGGLDPDGHSQRIRDELTDHATSALLSKQSMLGVAKELYPDVDFEKLIAGDDDPQESKVYASNNATPQPHDEKSWRGVKLYKTCERGGLVDC